jgi:branched-chain amino acid transport system ATP-binding protein
MSEPILAVEGITKRFGGLVALNNVSFELRPGEILGLMGPNGAGKTTLLNVIAGECTPDSGRVRFSGQDITDLPCDGVCHLGLARTFQIPQPFLSLTPREHMKVAAVYGRRGRSVRSELADDEILELVGLAEKADVIAGQLPILSLKRLEMARALACDPQVLLLDEVAAGSTEIEIPKVLATIKKVRSLGISLIIIEHVLKILFSAVDRVIVIDKGTKIAEGEPDAIICHPQVMEAYFGS